MGVEKDEFIKRLKELRKDYEECMSTKDVMLVREWNLCLAAVENMYVKIVEEYKELVSK